MEFFDDDPEEEENIRFFTGLMVVSVVTSVLGFIIGAIIMKVWIL